MGLGGAGAVGEASDDSGGRGGGGVGAGDGGQGLVFPGNHAPSVIASFHLGKPEGEIGVEGGRGLEFHSSACVAAGGGKGRQMEEAPPGVRKWGLSCWGSREGGCGLVAARKGEGGGRYEAGAIDKGGEG